MTNNCEHMFEVHHIVRRLKNIPYEDEIEDVFYNGKCSKCDFLKVGLSDNELVMTKFFKDLVKSCDHEFLPDKCRCKFCGISKERHESTVQSH
jgi:hypothetical protein